MVILPTGRFSFKEKKDNSRIAKVIDKKVLGKTQIQLNLHDGTNVLSKEKVSVGDSLELGFDSKIKKVMSIAKGKEVFIDSGRSVGLMGKVESIEDNKVKVDLGERSVALSKEHVIVIK